jgi:hypothetical protein
MANCFKCGSETILFHVGVPICVSCADVGPQAPQITKPIHAISTDELLELEHLKESVKVDWSRLYTLVLQMYGGRDNRTVRAEKIAASILRFEWAIERAADSDQTASAKA